MEDDDSNQNENFEYVIKPLVIMTTMALIVGFGCSTLITILIKNK